MAETSDTAAPDTAAPRDTAGPGPARHSFATGPVLLVAAAVALVLGTASDSALFFDEQYFLAAGRDHLAWGYMDQPPLVPALAALFGENPVLLRLPVTLGAALTAILAGALAYELGGRRSAQVLAAAATACSGVLLMAHWLATYTLDPLFWTAIVWLVARRLRTGDDRLLLAAGVVTGLSLNTKFLVPVLWAALLLALVAVGRAGADDHRPGPAGRGGALPGGEHGRAVLRAPALWGGLGIAALMTAPTLVWQAGHGWPYLGMAAVVRRESEAPLAFGLTGIALFGLVGAVLLVAGAVGAARGRNRWLGLTVVLVVAAILVAGGRAYYLLEIVPAALALGAVAITSSPGLRRTRGVLAGVGFAVSAAVLAVALPLPGSPGLLAAGEGTMLPAAAAVRQAWDGESTVVAQIYPLAAAIELDGIPAYSGHRGYAYFTPPTGDDALWVGVDPMPSEFRAGFAQCTPVPAEGLVLEQCRGRREPWSALLTPTT
ncbi:ArnT family glycosyltransferase [Pseudonocardia xishanensis]|uniref:Glycosyltransferase family 39 protein n=1 Tax=Pseudonocardia xishanensis TaxID=630995 RepID=A0ABP8RJG3_9PSEU